ncbi:hypothetical protein RRG08_016153 [Elysia crispata]|uniref:Uncharacterized protein n=1 Tax=Elysia crispata TaxID=231223 RepID=A0AAE0Z3Q9_9GAST|nr:hypothetical protein RRG08_016153 [Elysia crispata]
MRYGCIVLDIDLPLYEETVMSIPLQAAGSPSPPGGLQLVIGSDFSGTFTGNERQRCCDKLNTSTMLSLCAEGMLGRRGLFSVCGKLASLTAVHHCARYVSGLSSNTEQFPVSPDHYSDLQLDQPAICFRSAGSVIYVKRRTVANGQFLSDHQSQRD